MSSPSLGLATYGSACHAIWMQLGRLRLVYEHLHFNRSLSELSAAEISLRCVYNCLMSYCSVSAVSLVDRRSVRRSICSMPWISVPSDLSQRQTDVCPFFFYCMSDQSTLAGAVVESRVHTSRPKLRAGASRTFDPYRLKNFLRFGKVVRRITGNRYQGCSSGVGYAGSTW